jgi:hypothetical protein
MSRMVQLHRRETTTFADRSGHLRQTWQMSVAEDAQLSVKSNTRFLDVRGAGLHQCVPPLRNLSDPFLVEFRRETVTPTLLIGKRGQHETVSHCWTMQESKRFE